ncbi:MAG TPA: 1,4-dihydroxy-2-naphthoate octaprenyltransferase, partial [Candidatus Binatus sp.]|nr:1,4-dihydroxy-2-naphthoate octaprenyltransferase [Candidatus Binatus sp.]
PFLQASLVPIFLGGILAWEFTGLFNWAIFLLALLGGALVQVATNMFNDYFDYKSGNDLKVKHRNPFAGGGRILTAGLVSLRSHLLVSSASLVIGCTIGFYFLFTLNVPYLFWIGLVGVLSSYFYVGPPFRLAYRGVGEFFVGLNFGPIMTLGTYYVLTRSLDPRPVLASIPIGLLVTAILWINEFPDMDADKAVGKKTLVLRLGYSKSVAIYTGLVVLSYALVVAYIFLGVFPLKYVTTLLVFLTLPVALKSVKTLRMHYHDPHAMIPANAGTIMLHLSFGILMMIGFALGGLLSF